MILKDSICFKHDEIMRLAQSVIDMAEAAKDDGKRMERGLETKRDRIDALEAEVEGLKAELDRAERLIGSLHDQVESLEDENRAMAADLKEAR